MELKKTVALLFGLVTLAQAQMDFPALGPSVDTAIATAAMPQTPIFIVRATGVYRVTVLARTVTAGTAGQICWNLSWNDGETGSPVNDGICGGTTLVGGGPGTGYLLYAQANTPISFNTVLNGVTGPYSYRMHFRLEQL